MDRPGAIEPERWRALEFLTAPWCARCGFPFETPEAAEALCGGCLAKPPAYLRARSALAYGDEARKLVLDLKRAGRRDGLPTFARWMASAGAELLADDPVLVPVPLHWTRLFQRRFNQSAWLAQALAEATGAPVLVDGLVRVKKRRSQGGLSAKQRRRNVQGAFKVPPRAAAKIAGRPALLVDDVLTTGATVEACARALLRAKAARVDVLTLARVVRGADVVI